MSNLIDSKIFKLTFFSLLLAEIFSFWGWKISLVNNICFWALAILVLILSLKKTEYGLYFIFAELFVGSFGYLFSFSFGGTRISLRVIMFLIIMAVWLYRYLTRPATRHNATDDGVESRSKWRRVAIFYIFAAVLLLSFFQGLLRGHGFANTFLDFNNWLCFLLLLPVWSVVKNKKTDFTNTIISVLAATSFFLSLKTLFLFYIFSHVDGGLWTTTYKFVRDTLSGEITHVSGNVWRVFLQSQIYLVISFFVFLPSIFKDKNFKKYIFLSLILAALLASFSRSFWVGLGAGVLIFCSLSRVRSDSDESRNLGVSFLHKAATRSFDSSRILGTSLRINGVLAFMHNFVKILGVTVVAALIVFLALILPPKRDENAFLSALQGRFGLEAAASSRINQIGPLTQEILKSPLIGFGFGKTVTYQSNDPRIVPTTAGGSGEITTYAFEWGYLDMVLKFGVIGMSIYLFLIYLILKKLLISNFQFLISKQIQNSSAQNKNNYTLLVTRYSLQNGFALALIALLAVNIFSPYLNHPLGIGFIIIAFINTKL